MFSSPVTLTPDSNGTYLIGFLDFPKANSVGEDKEDALTQAVDALETALSIYFDERRPVPLPSPTDACDAVVALPALETAKVLVWNEMFSEVAQGRLGARA
jgi:antitoxin HicB